MSVRDWWVDFFDATFADVVLARRDDGETDRTIDLLRTLLRLEHGARLLDQGCGIGRLTIPLARRGYEVVGIDLAAAYVRRAIDAARAAGATCEFRVADAFEHVEAPACDGAFNWHTSFGYAVDDTRNASMVRTAFASLRPGARFALDYPNMPRVMRDFRPRMEQQVTTPRGELRVVRDSTLDLARGLLDQRWTYHFPDGDRTERRGVTRTYAPHELVAMFAASGFIEIELFDERGAPLTIEGERCVVVGRRPEL